MSFGKGTEEMLLTKRDVATRLSCHTRTVERLVASGRLKSIKILRAVRFKQSDVERIVHEGIV